MDDHRLTVTWQPPVRILWIPRASMMTISPLLFTRCAGCHCGGRPQTSLVGPHSKSGRFQSHIRKDSAVDEFLRGTRLFRLTISGGVLFGIAVLTAIVYSKKRSDDGSHSTANAQSPSGPTAPQTAVQPRPMSTEPVARRQARESQQTGGVAS